MQMRPRGDISKVAVRDGAAKRFENANFHDHTLIECLESSFLCIAADTWLGNLSRKTFFCGPLRACATPHADHAADTGGLGE